MSREEFRDLMRTEIFSSKTKFKEATILSTRGSISPLMQHIIISRICAFISEHKEEILEC